MNDKTTLEQQAEDVVSGTVTVPAPAPAPAPAPTPTPAPAPALHDPERTPQQKETGERALAGDRVRGGATPTLAPPASARTSPQNEGDKRAFAARQAKAARDPARLSLQDEADKNAVAAREVRAPLVLAPAKPTEFAKAEGSPYTERTILEMAAGKRALAARAARPTPVPEYPADPVLVPRDNALVPGFTVHGVPAKSPETE